MLVIEERIEIALLRRGRHDEGDRRPRAVEHRIGRVAVGLLQIVEPEGRAEHAFALRGIDGAPRDADDRIDVLHLQGREMHHRGIDRAQRVGQVQGLRGDEAGIAVLARERLELRAEEGIDASDRPLDGDALRPLGHERQPGPADRGFRLVERSAARAEALGELRRGQPVVILRRALVDLGGQQPLKLVFMSERKIDLKAGGLRLRRRADHLELLRPMIRPPADAWPPSKNDPAASAIADTVTLLKRILPSS